MDLQSFLNQKPLYYDEIDYTRFPRAHDAIKEHLQTPKIIHIIGTNAKGSTGRFLALILRANGRKVGHYTSPHITSFNERFWLDGALVSDKSLQNAHEKLIGYFKQERAEHFIDALSYFEWATLLAAQLFRDCDELIMEAGMGGEHDATNVFSKKLSIFSPIDMDHTAMLGDSLAQIARTKLNAMCENALLCGFNAKNQTIYNVAKDIAAKNGAKLQIAQFQGGINKAAKIYARKYSGFLRQNFYLAYFASKKLGAGLNKRILKHLAPLDLKGRFWQIKSNLILDVGHNAHAAQALKQDLNQKLRGKKASLIYNAFFDKDIKAVLSTLAPCFDEVLIYQYNSTQRKLGTKKIYQVCQELGLKCRDFTPADMQKIKKRSYKKTTNLASFTNKMSKNFYVVFGSFMLVDAFLGDFNGTTKK